MAHGFRPPDALPAGVQVCEFAEQPSGGIVTYATWMVPITDAERAVIGARGWGVFEEMLESADLDLFNPMRESLSTR